VVGAEVDVGPVEVAVHVGVLVHLLASGIPTWSIHTRTPIIAMKLFNLRFFLLPLLKFELMGQYHELNVSEDVLGLNGRTFSNIIFFLIF
jgi:hypothetical protein